MLPYLFSVFLPFLVMVLVVSGILGVACLVVYLQPRGEGQNVISFREVAHVVRRHDDPVSKRFAESLLRWAQVRAGEEPGAAV